MEIIYLWYLLIATGGLGAIYLYKGNFKGAGLSAGISSVTLGTVGVLTSYYGIDGVIFQALWITMSFSVVGTMYVASKSPRALMLLPVPVFLIAQAVIPSIPFFVLFAGLTLTMGVVDAHDFSRLDITACMKKGEKPLRALLVPFSWLENLVRQAVDEGGPTSLLFSFYLLLSVIITVVPILIIVAFSKAFEDSILLSFVLLPSLAYLSVARMECRKGLTHLNGSSQNYGRGPPHLGMAPDDNA